MNGGNGVAMYQNQWQKQCMTTDIDAPTGDQEVRKRPKAVSQSSEWSLIEENVPLLPDSSGGLTANVLFFCCLSHPLFQVWVGPLSDGSIATLFFNSASAPASISASRATLGLDDKASYTVKDLWKGTTSNLDVELKAEDVPSHGVAYFRVSKA